MQQCTDFTFQSSSVPVPIASIKGLASKHFFILQPVALLCGNTLAEKVTQHITFPLFGCGQFHYFMTHCTSVTWYSYLKWEWITFRHLSTCETWGRSTFVQINIIKKPVSPSIAKQSCLFRRMEWKWLLERPHLECTACWKTSSSQVSQPKRHFLPLLAAQITYMLYVVCQLNSQIFSGETVGLILHHLKLDGGLFPRTVFNQVRRATW